MSRPRRITRAARAASLVARRAAVGVRGRKLPAALGAACIAASLALVGLVRLGERSAAELVEVWSGGVQMVVYLEPGHGRERAERIGGALRELPAVEATEYVAPDRALARLRRAFGERDDVLAGIEADVLPASLEVKLARGVAGVAQVHPVMERLERTRGVEEVEFLGDWVGRVSAAARGLRALGLAMLIVAAAGCAFVVATTLELGLRVRRRERSILDRLGATAAVSRGPVIVEGALQGGLGAAGAIAILAGVYAVGAPAADRVLASALGAGPIAFLPARDLAALALAGAGVGVAGGFLASRRS